MFLGCERPYIVFQWSPDYIATLLFLDTLCLCHM